jgi:hypothetical protein
LYPPDFYRSIDKKIFYGIQYDEVSELLGPYEHGDCSTSFSKNPVYVRCMYDIRGDFVYRFTIVFDENGILDEAFFHKIAPQYIE